MSAEIEAINKQIAILTDRLDRTTARIEALREERRRLGYELHVNENHGVEAQLKKSRDELAGLSEHLETLAGAIAGLEQRKVVAQAAVARDVGKEHAGNALAILQELEALGPVLDRLVPHPRPEDGVAEYCPADPPTCCEAAKLLADLVNNHLRALGIGHNATFPRFWHGASNKFDLEKELMKTILAGWPSVAIQVAPRVKTVVMPGQRPRTPEFTKIFGGWAAVIRKNLAQHETEIAA
jgi:hypothetical protein